MAEHHGAELLVTRETWLRLYGDIDVNYGLRFQSGPQAPTAPVHGDRYGLTDIRYEPRELIRGSQHPPPTVEGYNRALAETIDLAAGNAVGWLLSDNKVTLGQTFDKINAAGRLYLMQAPVRAGVFDYPGALAKIGQRTMQLDEFLTAIPLVGQEFAAQYQARAGETWTASWKSEIAVELRADIRRRVAAAIAQLVG
ncbi:MAG TPA: hypothetical protein VOB72_26575 [Candidatus Dormibacteraeota bacterium]|nr:hypothetical protein [Candidatus Dormibacteraeota bacterium]